jgi:hypothetical protein
MNTLRIVPVLCLAATVSAAAQTQYAPASAPAGLLGQRYVEAGVGAVDPHGTSDLGFTGDLSANIPLQPGLDVGFGYTYSRIETDIFNGSITARARDHVLYASATAYSQVGAMKPFFGGAVGHRWNRSSLRFAGAQVFRDSDNESLWGLATGVEIPFGRFSVTPAISYQDAFRRDAAAGFTYGAEVHTWLTRDLGAFADITFSDPTGGGTQAWTYEVGVRLRF